ncbi:MAG TPA: acyltransferase [Spirochaetia bacterium]|nr:acyltransferase [Spirochaetia bacterium]
MLIEHLGFRPLVDPSAYIAPTAVLVGKVQAGPRARVMYGAVVDAEGSEVQIGECAIICENAVLRATAAGERDFPVLVGDHAFIGPHATLLGCVVEPCAYIATGATVLHGAIVRKGGAVAVGALVHARTVVPEGFLVPPNTIAIGDPLELFSPDEKEALAEAIKSLGFAKAAFGVEAAWGDRAERYRQSSEVRSREFGSHFDDKMISS